MSNFEDFKQKAKDTMETIADKSIELYKVAEEKTKLIAKTTKLSTEVTLEKGSLRRLYRQIGQKYYELHMESPEPAFEQACAEVTASLTLIAAKQKEIEELKKASNSNRCCEDETCDAVEVEILMEDADSDVDVPGVDQDPEDPDDNTAQAEGINNNN